MIQMNNHPLAQQKDEERTKLLMVAIWKASGGKAVEVTGQDILDFSAAFDGMPTLMLRGLPQSIEISVTSAGAAVLKAAAANSRG